MKTIYVSSVERYSGKTAACLALGKHFQADGYKVGYLKPLSLQPWQVSGKLADEDAGFVKEVLGLEAEPWELSPVVLNPSVLRSFLKGEGEADPMGRVRQAYEAASQGHDIMLLEGGGSMREGYAVGLPTLRVAKEFATHVIMIVKYRDDVRVLDDALAARKRLGESLCSIIINRVPASALGFVADSVVPFLENQQIPVLGILPEVSGLAALTVGELIDMLKAETLTQAANREAMVETLTVGAMTADAALSRFRKQTNKAVITGGDRTDIQLAALETSTTCLILTGNLRPSPLIIKQADDQGVPVLLVRGNTTDTIETIEEVFGKTRLGQADKLAQFEALMTEHIDYTRLYSQIWNGN